ncbi:MAG TPA: hypothetical protein V6C89_20025 [Drouetiella sp.]|jgi:hypothetical protein
MIDSRSGKRSGKLRASYGGKLTWLLWKAGKTGSMPICLNERLQTQGICSGHYRANLLTPNLVSSNQEA